MVQNNNQKTSNGLLTEMDHLENKNTSLSYFEQQRNLLIQEITNSMDLVIYNLDVLNRSLNESVQVGKEFDEVGRLWTHFYNGFSQMKQYHEKNSKNNGKNKINSLNEETDHNQTQKMNVKNINHENQQ